MRVGEHVASASLGPVDDSQRKAAKVVGFTYLLALATSVFAEFYVRGSLIVLDDAAQTARNIVAHEGLFRLGIVAGITTLAADVALIAALYVVLAPVARHLALAAAFWRLIETAVIALSAVSDLEVLRLLSGAPYAQPLGTDGLQALARLSVGSHGASFLIGLLFFGFGSTLFCYLWYRSGYVPRALAGLGVFGSALTGLCSYVFLLFPRAAPIASPGCYAPIFFFELIMGLWLLGKQLGEAQGAKVLQGGMAQGG
jgi:hypothetical protein